jgi:membrane-bound lytic murein transglycosylase D
VKIHTRFPNVKAFFNLFVALIFIGCVTQTSHVKSNIQTQPEKAEAKEPDLKPTPAAPEEKQAPPPKIEEPQQIAALPKTKAEEEKEPVSPLELPKNTIPAPAPEPPKKSDQELLDSALEFCHVSNDFWERGDLENALDALDQAYSLVLEVHPDEDPEILQQRDDLRITISKRIIEIYTSRFTVANGYRKAIPLVMNSHVETAVRLLEGNDKRFFIDS